MWNRNKGDKIMKVETKGGFYFKIKNSKGKEKSWTSLIDFWKQWFEIKEIRR